MGSGHVQCTSKLLLPLDKKGARRGHRSFVTWVLCGGLIHTIWGSFPCFFTEHLAMRICGISRFCLNEELRKWSFPECNQINPAFGQERGMEGSWFICYGGALQRADPHRMRSFSMLFD